MSGMPLRRRVTLAAAVVVAVAVLVTSSLAYLLVSSQLRGQVDDQLLGLARQAQAAQGPLRLPAGEPGPAFDPPDAEGGLGVYVAVRTPDGTVSTALGQELRLPFDARDLALARGEEPGPLLRDKEVDGRPLRAVTVRMGGGLLQAARPVDEIEAVLGRLRVVLALLVAGGIALAAFLGRLAGRGLVAPLAEVADAAQHVGETDDLARRLVVRSDDEVGQLATRFNAMLDRLQAGREALDDSVRAQRQLVADASHELRTPITSLRTNVEVLLDERRLDPASRERLLDDVREQTEELGALVADLIELARGDHPLDDLQDVRLDHLAEEAVTRARRHAPRVAFVLHAEPVALDGDPERLGRALNNLLDNAARHSPPGGRIDVTVGPGGLEVRDHGEGIDPADLPQLFDRFYRGSAARGRQGTGLGLAIVRQAAETHGGSAEAANAEGGGARFTLRLPGRAVAPADGDREPGLVQLGAPHRPRRDVGRSRS